MGVNYSKIKCIIRYMKNNDNTDVRKTGLSIIIPTYNGAPWLNKTIAEIEKSVIKARLQKFEIVVIDDGSTDDTVAKVNVLAKSIKSPLRVVSQKNGGRFVARKTGAAAAKYEYLLYVDTRVFIGRGSLAYVLDMHLKDPSRAVWCSHVRVDKKGNIYARFWEAVAYVAWRDYFSRPRDISYGIDEFDKYPKGTTCFFIKRSVLVEANEWFIKNTKDLKTSNDDTLLIRHIAENNSINVSPSFWCLYHARGTLRQYTKHVYHRGKVFVDGFLRNDGNRFFVPLILFLILSAALPVALVVKHSLVIPTLFIGFVLWLLQLLLLLALGAPTKDALSLFILTPIFSIFYGAGIWNAFIKIYVLKRTS